MNYQLKSNIATEPLVARYAAQPYLLSPSSSPRFFRRLVKGILASFVKSPRAHELALANPALRGGPFVTLSSQRVGEVSGLLDGLRSSLDRQFQFADAQDELVSLLLEAEGQPLDTLVDRIPKPLQGLVELFYERSGKASYRIIEGLAYHADWHDDSLQEIMLYPLTDDEREFVLTTPRLAGPERLILRLPLRSPVIDELASARYTPVRDLSVLATKLGVPEAQQALFESFFVAVPIDPVDVQQQKQKTDSIMTRYFGHACVEVTSPKGCVVIDPFISYAIPDKKDGRLTLQDLPKWIDALVITHLHLDHFCVETLLQLRHKIGCVIVPKGMGGSAIDPSAKRILKSLGFANIVELGEMETHFVSDLTIQALPFHGEHGDLDIAGKAIFTVSAAGRTALFAADTRIADQSLLTRIATVVGKIDLIFLGMESEGAPLSWVYGPLLDTPIERKWDQIRRLNGSNAELGLNFVNAFASSRARVYALGREPWLSHIMSVDGGSDTSVQLEIDSFIAAGRDRDIDCSLLFMNHVEAV